MARIAEQTTTERIARIQHRIRSLESQKQQMIMEAREESVTWQAIAEALGVSRQAAWESYARGRHVLDRVRERSDLDEEAARTLAGEALAEVRSRA